LTSGVLFATICLLSRAEMLRLLPPPTGDAGDLDRPAESSWFILPGFFIKNDVLICDRLSAGTGLMATLFNLSATES
jgi:hypothetical protein